MVPKCLFGLKMRTPLCSQRKVCIWRRSTWGSVPKEREMLQSLLAQSKITLCQTAILRVICV